MAEEKVYSIEDLAERWGVHKTTVVRMVNAGKLKGFRVGNLWRFREEDIMKYERGGGAKDDAHGL